MYLSARLTIKPKAGEYKHSMILKASNMAYGNLGAGLLGFIILALFRKSE
jgi:hypothetical protein